MNRFILAVVCAPAVVASAVAYAQGCVVQAPPTPPRPPALIITIPPSGTTGCTAAAPVSSAVPPGTYLLSPAKCAQAVSIALQAAANDNGWNDGGVP